MIKSVYYNMPFQKKEIVLEKITFSCGRFLLPIFLLLCFSVVPLFSNATDKRIIVVALDGSGDFSSIQQAIDASNLTGISQTVIYVKNGTYSEEKLIIPEGKGKLIIRGESREHTVISYYLYDCKNESSANKCPAGAWERWKDNKELIRTSATLTILANDVVMENLTLANTAGPVGQALAVTLRGDRISFYHCDILGYQDTIFLAKDAMRNYFYDCLILGRTDYIYGGGIGYFDNCEIRSFGGGWVTAPSTPEFQQYGFVFNRCRFTYASNSPAHRDNGKLIALGRPWHNFPKVAILNSELCREIDPAGWPTPWNMAYATTSDKLQLFEYNNIGDGSSMNLRSKWRGLRGLSSAEAKQYKQSAVLNGWIPVDSKRKIK